MTQTVDLLRDLVALPSVNPCGGDPDAIHGEARMVDYLVHWLAARRIDYALQEVWPGRHNVLARLEGRGGPSLVFEAHTDTVAVAGMDIDPFAPDVRDGRVYGRGSCDCKASLAAMLVALEATAAAGTPPGDITLAATCDEEYRFSGVKYMTDHGFRAGGGVVGEPTNLDLIIAHKGALRAGVITRGRAWHSSEPHKGESAIFHMGRVLAAVEDYGRDLSRRAPHPLVAGPSVSIGLISGGQAPNIVPDRCEIAIDRRIMPGEDPAAVPAELRQWLIDHLDGVPWEMTVLICDGGLEGRPDSDIAQRCAVALDRVLNRHTVGGVQYGTDASKFAAAGIPSVVLGPGDIAQAHTACEWVEIEQVEAATAIYAAIMDAGST